ncbi:MAG TPA: hypothetical protein VMJ14_12955, partial [Burkholderiales bacterium]|nr:hypothetical protein [Burkholderiales bacterium]
MGALNKSQEQVQYFHYLSCTTTDAFVTSVSNFNDNLQEKVFTEFTDQFPGQPIDEHGYLRCAKVDCVQCGLYFAVATSGGGLHLIALPQIEAGDIFVPVDESLTKLIEKAREVGIATKGIEGLKKTFAALLRREIRA